MLSMFLVKDQDSNSTHLISTDFSVLGTVYELKKFFCILRRKEIVDC